MSKRELDKTDRDRLRGVRTFDNNVLCTGQELSDLNEFMDSMPDEMFGVLVEIVTDIANIRANDVRDKLVEKITSSVSSALEIDEEDDRVTTIEDTVYETVNRVFLKRFGDA